MLEFARLPGFRDWMDGTQRCLDWIVRRWREWWPVNLAAHFFFKDEQVESLRDSFNRAFNWPRFPPVVLDRVSESLKEIQAQLHEKGAKRSPIILFSQARQMALKGFVDPPNVHFFMKSPVKSLQHAVDLSLARPPNWEADKFVPKAEFYPNSRRPLPRDHAMFAFNAAKRMVKELDPLVNEPLPVLPPFPLPIPDNAGPSAPMADYDEDNLIDAELDPLFEADAQACALEGFEQPVQVRTSGATGFFFAEGMIKESILKACVPSLEVPTTSLVGLIDCYGPMFDQLRPDSPGRCAKAERTTLPPSTHHVPLFQYTFGDLHGSGSSDARAWKGLVAILVLYQLGYPLHSFFGRAILWVKDYQDVTNAPLRPLHELRDHFLEDLEKRKGQPRKSLLAGFLSTPQQKFGLSWTDTPPIWNAHGVLEQRPSRVTLEGRHGAHTSQSVKKSPEELKADRSAKFAVKREVMKNSGKKHSGKKPRR